MKAPQLKDYEQELRRFRATEQRLEEEKDHARSDIDS